MLKSTTELDAIIAKATKDPYHELTRFVFRAASSDEDTVSSGKGGYARLPKTPVDRNQLEREGEPITEDSIFELYSCTKLPTTIATLQLVEQGKLDLDDEIRQFVPECGQVKVLEGFNEDGSPKLAEPDRAVTVRMLLTHTSGKLNDSVGGPDYSPEHAPFRLLLRNDRPELAQGRREARRAR